ncbi:PhnD/SsuA/transferrin family substrate-binding protein [uncultured Cohaesibacter sp.]|uniref:phosphate/phosphite/phosphonate ABC transporter substrate-binding protein n=1 Tax=uncultured Cohaesibacter sp. TaxID=1002546 RepID=UPI0029C85993|nr:PhnD/SsuA/transferrin family substrate-binding protein [uncultured Cohaesibacter sp.]
MTKTLLAMVLAAGAGLVSSGGLLAQEGVERHALEALDDATRNALPSQFPATDAAPLPDTGSIIDRTAPDPSNTIELLDNKPPLRIGLVAERGASYLQARIEPFRSYLQESLSRPVEVVAFNSMTTLMAAHISHQVDYSIYPASIFSMAYASCGCLTPMVAPVSREAPDGVYMVLVVRGASGIKSLADLSGRSMALSSKNGAIPFYMAMNELKKSGLNPERDLASLVGRDNPGDALALLEDGSVDAALVWSTTPYNQSLFTSEGAISAYARSRSGRGGDATNPDFLSIWHSPAVPAGPHVIHDEVSKQDRADLINALKEMSKVDPAAYDAVERRYDGGFRSVELKDYEPLIEIATKR